MLKPADESNPGDGLPLVRIVPFIRAANASSDPTDLFPAVSKRTPTPLLDFGAACDRASTRGVELVRFRTRLAGRQGQLHAAATLKMGIRMVDQVYLTPEELAERYRGAVSLDTLRNWRSLRIGPSFVKVGKSVLYPIVELDQWDKCNTVTCATDRLRDDGE